jgi:hypothetical protein
MGKQKNSYPAHRVSDLRGAKGLMYNFRVLTGQDNGLMFPDWASPDLAYFAARILGECHLQKRDLSWDEIDMLAGFASRELKAAAHFSAKYYENFLKDKANFSKEDIEFYKKCSTPEGLLLAEGPGLVLREWLDGSDEDNGRRPAWELIEKVLPGKDILCVLYSYALLCIDNSLSAQIAGDVRDAVGNVAIAGDVVAMATEHYSRESATNWAKKLASEPRKKGARVRHAETYALRAEVIEYWKTKIDSRWSADKAALTLTKIFPLSHRKLSEYVSAEKNMLRTSKE